MSTKLTLDELVAQVDAYELTEPNDKMALAVQIVSAYKPTAALLKLLVRYSEIVLDSQRRPNKHQ